MNVNINLKPKKSFIKKIIILILFTFICFFIKENVFAVSVSSFLKDYSEDTIYCNSKDICLDDDYQNYIPFLQFYEKYFELLHSNILTTCDDCENYPYENCDNQITSIYFFDTPVYVYNRFNQGHDRISFYYRSNDLSSSASGYSLTRNKGQSLWYFTSFTDGGLFFSSSSKFVDSTFDLKDFLTSEIIFNTTDNSKEDMEIIYNKNNSILDNIVLFFSNFVKNLSNFGNTILNGIKDLFVPGDELEGFFNDEYEFICKKLGFLAYPIEIIIDFTNRFYSLEDTNSAIFKIPKLELMGNILYEGTTFDLMSLVNSNDNFKNIYNIYKIAVSGFIVLWLVQLAIKKEQEMFGGGSN